MGVGGAPSCSTSAWCRGCGPGSQAAAGDAAGRARLHRGRRGRSGSGARRRARGRRWPRGRPGAVAADMRPSGTGRTGWIEAVDRSVTAADLAGRDDLSLWGLFLQADLVVKLVMLRLLARQRLGLGHRVREGDQRCAAPTGGRRVRGPVLVGRQPGRAVTTEGDEPRHPMAAVFVAAMGEWRRSAQRGRRRHVAAAGVRERVDRAIAVTVQREMDRMERWMVFLASVGSTAPFIGLFGTVWGIMRSLLGHRGQQQHQPRGRRARHRRGAVRDRDRPGRRHPGGARLQQDQLRPRPLRRPAGGLRQRVRRHPVAPDRGAGLSRTAPARRGSPWRLHGQRPRAGPLPAAGRDQRHAAGRRDAGAADHLHGRRAADDLGRARSTCRRPARRRSTRTASR